MTDREYWSRMANGMVDHWPVWWLRTYFWIWRRMIGRHPEPHDAFILWAMDRASARHGFILA